jgi:soluble lytic murein transglycosylase-like protein
MLGIGRTLARFPAATALIAGAAFLAGAGSQRAMAQAGGAGLPSPGDDMAMAVPRITSSDGGGVSLPRPLPPSDAARVRRVFALQDQGDIPAALRESARLDGGTTVGNAMLGHILAARYLGPHTRPDADQLRDWLDRWSDLPDARAIHALLVVRMPRGESAPPLPPGIAQADESEAAPVPEETEPDATALRRDPALDHAVWNAARTHGAAFVQRLLQRGGGVAPPYAAQLRGEAARILFTLNRDTEAYDLAAAGVLGGGSALSGYVAGLAAWRTGRLDNARAMFQAAWRADVTTPALQAAAAFWAARTHSRAGDSAGAVPWLLRAAEHRSTFYGLLARRTLGLKPGAWPVGRGERETLGEADIDAVAATPPGLRAFALLQVDQPDRAAAELRLLWPAAKASRPLARAVMLVAAEAGLTDLAVQYADLLAAADGRPREAMRFPLPRLRPEHGFTIDPAMVYGLARTESNFDSALVSSAGARGLLQIMPDTASFLLGRHDVDSLADMLHDPAVNLDLGQRYMSYLAKNEAVNGDLIRLLAAYNSGPASFARWASQIRDNGDPLLFIEAIPLDETRAHVPRVLTYTWMYASRLHLPTDSLDALAAGVWPRFRPFDAARSAATRVASSQLN